MKILVLGASGVIGSAIYEHLSIPYEVYGTYNKNKPTNIGVEHLCEYDVADLAALDNMLRDIKPDLIISSLTGDFLQQLKAHTRITEYLGRSLGRAIFLSSANVFDGSPNVAHTERETPYPISQYGKYKYTCEQLLESCLGDRCLIVRLPRTLSKEGALKEIQQLEDGHPVISNLIKSYNSADNAAKAIRFCIEANKHGVIHLTSTDSISDVNHMRLLLSHFNKNAQYRTERFTLKSYCAALGCDDTNLIRCADIDELNLSLKSVDIDLPKSVSLSCKAVIDSL